VKLTARGLVVPAYFHPAVAGTGWRELAAAASAVRAVILNVADGPGTAPEAELTAAAVGTGAPLLGYVDTDYGARRVADVLADLNRHLAWYPVTGFFLDRVATDPALLPWYEPVTRLARLGGTVVFNHGAYPAPGYAALADALVTFEGPYAAYRRVVVPAWARRLPADRFWHLVYDAPAAVLPEVLDRAAACNVGAVYVTDRSGANPWGGLPDYFAAQAQAWAR
jgi:hypothetical protein